MFIGHYGPAFLLKKHHPHVPLWLLFVFAQGSDILFFLFINLGLEKYRIIETENRPLQLDFYQHPFSHSLFSIIVISVAVFLLFRLIGRKTWAPALSLAFISHWFLDLIVHVDDLPVFFGNHKLGFGLWNYEVASLIVECMIPIACFWYLRSSIVLSARDCFFLALLVISQIFYQYIIPIPPVPWGFALLALSIYFIQAVSAYLNIDKKTVEKGSIPQVLTEQETKKRHA